MDSVHHQHNRLSGVARRHEYKSDRKGRGGGSGDREAEAAAAAAELACWLSNH